MKQSKEYNYGCVLDGGESPWEYACRLYPEIAKPGDGSLEFTEKDLEKIYEQIEKIVESC